VVPPRFNLVPIASLGLATALYQYVLKLCICDVQWRSQGHGDTCPPYLGQTRSCDSRKSEEKVRGYPAQPLFLVEKYSTEDRTGLLITNYHMVLCMVV
jgi:hypothetical protein